MTAIRVSTLIPASPAEVWADLADISSHVEWMADAESIRFTSPGTDGVGTSFTCATRVGPIRLEDRMEVTQWEPERTMGVHHVGLVTGSGRFDLEPVAGGHTRFSWSETLRFPWWMGGPIGGFVGGLLLRRIWAGNLRRLKERFPNR